MRARQAAQAVGRWAATNRADLCAVVGIVAIALAFVAPALKDGVSFGGFDLDTTLTSLGAGLYPVVHNHTNGDALSQMVSWNTLDWRAVRAGHFPLWNDYSGLGMPEFTNFESSVLSLPDLVSYAFPLRAAFLVVVVVKLVLAGTGTYLFPRVLRLGVLPSLLGGVSFMLAGAFSSWLTWPLTDVVAWTGFICGFGVLAYRSPRLRWIFLLAISVAFSVYGGFPEANVMVAFVLVALVVGTAASAVVRRRRMSLAGALRAAAGGVGGVLLSMPLWFPGLQVIAVSHRTTEGNYVGLPLKVLPLVLAEGYYGLPTGPASTFSLSTINRWNYYETVSYVGVIVIVLAAVAVITAYRRPVVAGLVLALLLALGLTYEPVGFHPLLSLVDKLGPLSAIRFERMRVLDAFILAVLGAIGLEQLIAVRTRFVRRTFLGAVAAAVLVLGVIGLGPVIFKVAPNDGRPHLVSLALPLACVALLAASTFVLASERVRRSFERMARIAVVALVGGESAFLFFSGIGIASYSRAFYPATPAETRLESIVGAALVGLDNGDVKSVRGGTGVAYVGFYPEVNIGYGVRIFAIHDPLLPNAYFTSWPVPGAAPSSHGVGLFVPDIDSVALAHRYGVQYVLAAAGLSQSERHELAAMTEVADLNGEMLYKVPGSARFSFASPGAADAGDAVVAVSGSANAAFSISTRSVTRATLVMRVTSEPGWHATIDGRAASVTSYDGVMESVVVPAGSHVVRLWYRPGRLVTGVVVALGSVCAGLGAVVGCWGWRRRRGAPRREHSDVEGSDDGAASGEPSEVERQGGGSSASQLA